MKFSNPYFLWLLFSLIIPIIIHFFSFRKIKTQYFTNVNLLKKISIKKRKLNQIKRWVILSIRLLAIISLIMVFAKPYFPKNKNMVIDLVNIYVDNSASMENMYGNMPQLDIAKKKAKEIIMFYGSNKLFKIFSCNSPINPPVLNKEDAIAAIDVINSSYVNKNLSSIIASFNLDNQKNYEPVNYYISDFQVSVSDFENITTNNKNLYLIPCENKSVNNLFIKDVAPTIPISVDSKNINVQVVVDNQSDMPFEKVPLSLYINKKLISSVSFNIEANSSVTIPMAFSNDNKSILNAFVSINDNSITFDNTFYFTYKQQQQIAILNIYFQQNKYINALFANDSLFKYSSIDYKYLKYDNLNAYDLIILDGLPEISEGLTEELLKLSEKKLNILFIPATSNMANIPNYNLFFKKFTYGNVDPIFVTEDKNTSIAFESAFFKDVFYDITSIKEKNVDLPAVYKYYPINKSDDVLSLINLSESKANIFSYKKINKATLFVFNVPIDKEYTNIQLNTVFVPIMYKIALNNNIMSSETYSSDDKIINLNISTDTIKNLILTCSDNENIRNYYFETKNKAVLLHFTNNEEIKAGNYLIEQSNTPVDGFSINYNRNESVLKFYNPSEIKEKILANNISNTTVIESTDNDFKQKLAADVGQGTLWKTFLYICALLLITEMLLLRFWE